MRMTALVFVCASFMVGCSWGEGSGQDDPGGVDANVNGGGVCGDGVCAANEVASCSADCGSGGGGGGGGGSAICGNSTCETGETPTSCPNDCSSGGGSGSGSGSGSAGCPTPAPAIEDCIGCIAGMCPGGLDFAGCFACASGGGGLPTGGCNNDMVCDPAEMIDPNCADCP
ncbi:MAG: hypothetical protein AB7T06_03010 [Kofleriaceae bacterium]